MPVSIVAKPLKKAAIFLGETDSGKSTFLQIVEDFLGSDNVSHVAIQELEADKFAAADLLGKRANIYADIDKSELKKSARFKTSTGGDTIRVQRKHGHGFDLKPYQKHFFSANQAPQVSDESTAFWNRWIPIRCTTHFVSEDEIDGWRDPKTGEIPSNVKLKIPNIIERLTTPEAKSGILNILLKRLPKIIKTGAIPNAPTIEEVRQIWLMDANFQAQFLKATVRLEPEGRVGRAELYSHYTKWCNSKKVTAASQTVFNREVERLGAIRSEDGKGKFSSSGANWKGIAWLGSNPSSQQNIIVAEATEPTGRKTSSASSASSASVIISKQKTLTDGSLRAFQEFQKFTALGEMCPECGRMMSDSLISVHRALSHPKEGSV